MAVIVVNHETLRALSQEATDYCTLQETLMTHSDKIVKDMLFTDWIGTDAQEFGKLWEGVDEKGSTANNFKESLKNYSDAVNACADVYQKAQENAYNRANRLPKILTW